MNVVKQTALTWRTASGKELVRLDAGSESAEVIVARCTEADLRALAQAANDAADTIRDAREGRSQAA
jgi:type IV secretory pathway VirD2 relaxase